MKFKGFRRSDGSVGIRNHVVILPGCICSAGAARKIAAAAEGTTYLYNPNGCAQNTEDVYKRQPSIGLTGIVCRFLFFL